MLSIISYIMCIKKHIKFQREIFLYITNNDSYLSFYNYPINYYMYKYLQLVLPKQVSCFIILVILTFTFVQFLCQGTAWYGVKFVTYMQHTACLLPVAGRAGIVLRYSIRIGS